MFAVLRIDQWYDGVEGIECIDAFPTEEEANQLKQSMEKERDESYRKKIEYIENFVDNIVLPETDYQGWLEFLPKYFGKGCMYVFPKDFKRELKPYLNNYEPKLEGFNPPQKISGWDHLWVVEIKSKIKEQAKNKQRT